MDAWIAIGAIGAILTATFTGGYLVIAWRAHRHAVIASGRAHPIVLQPIRVPHAPVASIMAAYRVEDRERLRTAYLRVVNQSDLPQTIAIDKQRSRIIWPLAARHVRIHSDHFDVPAQTEGDLWLRLISADGKGWPNDQTNSVGNFEGRYYLRLRGRTARNIGVRFTGRVILGPHQ